MERYTCPRELLPVIESALAAEGYVIEQPLQRAVGPSRVTVMTRGSAMIALHEDLARDTADIHVYPADEAARLTILEELPRLIPTPLGRRSAR
jgi:hypothetical protein